MPAPRGNPLIKSFLKHIIASPRITRLARGARVIFVFHDVSECTSPQHSPSYSTTPKAFADQLDTIGEHFQFVSTEQLLSLKPSDLNYAAITFDDGFKSVLDIALPLLQKRNIPFTLFLNGSALIDGQNWILNSRFCESSDYIWRLAALSKVKIAKANDFTSSAINSGVFTTEFRENYYCDFHHEFFLNSKDVEFLVRNHDVRIGNHGFDHFVMSRTPKQELTYQIVQGHKHLCDLAGRDVEDFAIPFGHKSDYNQAVLEALYQNNYKRVFITNPNLLNEKAHSTGVMLLPRIGLTSEDPRQVLFYINRAMVKTYDL